MAGSLLQGQEIGIRIGERWILRGISLELAPGEFVGLSGPSGSGKTLLQKALVKLIPLNEGHILWQGIDLDRLELTHYRTRVLYLAQQPYLGPATVEAALQSPFHYRSQRTLNYNSEQARELLAFFQKGPEFLAQPVATLSGGEQQIVALVRALLLNPQVLLLDEPTSAMDPLTAEKAELQIKNWLTAQPSRAVLITSHDPEQLGRLVSRKINL